MSQIEGKIKKREREGKREKERERETEGERERKRETKRGNKRQNRKHYQDRGIAACWPASSIYRSYSGFFWALAGTAAKDKD